MMKKLPQRNTLLAIIAIVVLLTSAAVMLWSARVHSSQSFNAMIAGVYFDGEYRIEDGPWQPIVSGQHIPSTKGDVTLRGNFHLLTPDGVYIGLYDGGMPIALYTNHINLTFLEDGSEPYVMDVENPLFGDSSCCVTWSAHTFSPEPDGPIEILIHNPHRFGNELAIDEMLSTMALWSGIDFEKGQLDKGMTQRNTGLVFVIVAFVLLGTALFSTLIHIQYSSILWLFGQVILSAGAYFIFGSPNVSFWQESNVTNTIMLGVSMMLYMLFLSMVVTYFLRRTKKAGILAIAALCVTDLVFILLSTVTNIYFYDTWLYWAAAQTIVNCVLLVCLAKESRFAERGFRLTYLSMMLPLIAFILDALMTHWGFWQGGLISMYVFCILFIVAMIIVLRIIPRGINAAAKAQELETERNALNAQLAQSRISTMMSQIRPHFIYNALGTIEYLCEEDPKTARKLVHSFAKYLRGNFGELDNPRPIRMSQEIEHVRHYVNIEKVRFPDMDFTFEMNSDDFMLPALTIQPIVENAIKHGLMPLDHGGSVRVTSWETPTHYCVTIEDDGVGFDPGILLDERSHIGLRNIRERLEAMVDGTLTIHSTLGKGTTVRLEIPKTKAQ